jgi:carbon-monoxide dehydrogenase large subunit
MLHPGKARHHTTSQNPHVIRLLMGAFVLGIPEHKLRVVAPDVGGGFGSKIYHYAEEALVHLAAAKKLGRPVKWTSPTARKLPVRRPWPRPRHQDRTGAGRGRQLPRHPHRHLANMGAYLSTFATAVPTFLHGTLMAGNYKTPLIYVNVKAVFTNTVPVDAYRGAGRPEATYQLERTIDKAARELGVDPVELRRKNFITPDAVPLPDAGGVVYDTGNYQATLDKLELADWRASRRARPSAARGKLRGLGLSPCYIEACGIAPSNLVGQLGARVGLYDAPRCG